MSKITKFQRFIDSQKNFLKFFKDSFFKPFSLDKMLEEQDEQHRIRKEELKKQSMESLAKLRVIADLQYAQHKIQDRTKELDYLFQKRELNKKNQMMALEQLLSSIELDEDGYIKKKPIKDLNIVSINNNNNNNLNNEEKESEYINTSNFDFDAHFIKPKQFSEEEYSKVIETINNNNNNNNNYNNNINKINEKKK
ncbi:hypothetical protein ACTA71_002117 [Dictyostelium dimigraforme]